MTTKWAGWIVAALALTALAAGAVYAASHSTEVRITARQLEDGRVEFALQPRVDGEWGSRQLPRSRFFPADAQVGRWLNSSPLTVSVEAESNEVGEVADDLSVSPPSGDSGNWRSTIHRPDWDGRQDVEMSLASTDGWRLRLSCTDNRLDVDVWRYSEFDYDIDSGTSAVKWRFGSDGRVHRGQWFFTEPSWHSRWYSPHSGWLQTLVGKSQVTLQFGSGRWSKTVTFDVAGMANAAAWSHISTCGPGLPLSSSFDCAAADRPRTVWACD